MPKPGYNQLSYYQRRYLKEMLDEGRSKVEIARRLHVSRTTIFNELKRGTVDGVYNPDYREEQVREQKRLHGIRISVIKKNPELAEAISRMILEKQFSPEQVVDYFKEHPQEFAEYPKAVGTIYTAIDEGNIPGVTRRNLYSYSYRNEKISTVRSDHNILIPREIVEELHIKHGDRYVFKGRQNGDIVLKKVKGQD